MIADLLDVVRRRVSGGGSDALWRREERTAIAFESGRLKSAGTTEEAGVNLRVVQGGRVGVAGTTAADAATATCSIAPWPRRPWANLST